MKPLPYKHFFTVQNGKFVWEEPQMFKAKKLLLEGKRGYAVIEEISENASSNQLAYYFGGIIRQECMNSEAFAGLSEREIHNYLLTEVAGSMRQIHRPDGSVSLIEMPGDFDSIKDNKKKMSEYLQKVIALLNTEWEIFPKSAENYKTNQFLMKKKHYK